MNLTPQILLAFGDELEKQAVAADLVRQGLGLLKSRAGTAGALGGAGAALGGLAGGGIGGAKAYREARRAGATRGQAAMYGVGKGVKGATKGALMGGAAGAGLGLAAGGAGGRAAELAEKITGKGALGAPSRFAQRQVHSVTGYGTTGQVKAMGAGSASASKRATKAKEGLEKAWGGDNSKSLKKALTEKEMAGKGLQAAEKAEGMGLTSIPGYVKSFVKDPLKTMKAGVGEQWHGSGAGGKSMMIGLPVGMTGLSVAAPTEEGGPGRLERGARSLAGTAALAAAPISGMMGMGMMERGVGRAAGLVGAGGDVAMKRRKRRRRMGGELPESQKGPESNEENAPHPQVIHSPAAMGRAPESMGM